MLCLRINLIGMNWKKKVRNKGNMAKEKFDKYTQYDIVGTLDRNDDDQLIVVSEGMEYPLEELMEEMLGQQIQLKCQIET